MNFGYKLKIVAFELACKTVFEDPDQERVPELLTWSGNDVDTEIPKGFKLQPLYIPLAPAGTDVKKIINSTTKVLYDMLVTGAMVAAEHGEAEHLSMGELVELVEKL